MLDNTFISSFLLIPLRVKLFICNQLIGIVALETNSFQYVRNLSNSKLAKVIESNLRYRTCQRGAGGKKKIAQMCEINVMHSSSQVCVYHYMFTSPPVYNILQYLPVFLHYLDTLYYSCNAYSREIFCEKLQVLYCSYSYFVLSHSKISMQFEAFHGVMEYFQFEGTFRGHLV